MKPKLQTSGGPVARKRRDGREVKLRTFIPLKIWKRGGSKIVVRPDGQVEAAGKAANQSDQPVLVALTRAFYWQKLLDDGLWAVAARSPSAKSCIIRRSTNCGG